MQAKTLFLAGLLGLAATGAFAQVRTEVVPALTFKHLSNAELAALVDKPAPLTLSLLSNHETWYTQHIARNASGEVEIHDHWIDIINVTSGEATLLYGGTASGGHSTGPGETRGGVITGGTSVAMGPGDYIQIPAGTPHQTILKPGAKFRITVVKVKE